jgi:hypothetical protein
MEEADLRPTAETIRCFGAIAPKPVGEAVLMCIVQVRMTLNIIVSHAHQPLLSVITYRNLSLIEICNTIELTSKNREVAGFIKKYDRLFHGIEKFKKIIHLEVNETVKPLIDPPS